MLCGIYLGLGVVGILFVLFLLDDFSRGENNETSSDGTAERKSFKSQLVHVKSTFMHLKKRNQLLVIPITCWLGFEQGFIGAEFTKSFVACSKGVNYVGLTMICLGVTDTIGRVEYTLQF